jgi:hypothetical protein
VFKQRAWLVIAMLIVAFAAARLLFPTREFVPCVGGLCDVIAGRDASATATTSR